MQLVVFGVESQLLVYMSSLSRVYTSVVSCSLLLLLLLLLLVVAVLMRHRTRPYAVMYGVRLTRLS